jgi:hypothetical protein
MQGTTVIIHVEGNIVSVTEWDKWNYDAMDFLDYLRRAVGGSIETVPYFARYDGKPCIAYCNEEGKIKGMPVNRTAQMLWMAQTSIANHDVLVGNIVVAFGDDEFMEAM